MGRRRPLPKRPRPGPISDSVAAVPRSFDFSVESPASVEQIHSAFSEEDYWLARLAAFGGVGRLDSLIIDTDGSVTVVIIAGRAPRRAARAGRQVLPPQLASRAEGDVEPDRRRPGARGDQHRGARRAGIRAWDGFARTGAERLAPEVHRDRGIQSPVNRRQDREHDRPPAGPSDSR